MSVITDSSAFLTCELLEQENKFIKQQHLYLMTYNVHCMYLSFYTYLLYITEGVVNQLRSVLLLFACVLYSFFPITLFFSCSSEQRRNWEFLEKMFPLLQVSIPQFYSQISQQDTRLFPDMTLHLRNCRSKIFCSLSHFLWQRLF